jgi:hypothetical protein
MIDLNIAGSGIGSSAIGIQPFARIDGAWILPESDFNLRIANQDLSSGVITVLISGIIYPGAEMLSSIIWFSDVSIGGIVVLKR